MFLTATTPASDSREYQAKRNYDTKQETTEYHWPQVEHVNNR